MHRVSRSFSYKNYESIYQSLPHVWFLPFFFFVRKSIDWKYYNTTNRESIPSCYNHNFPLERVQSVGKFIVSWNEERFPGSREPSGPEKEREREREWSGLSICRATHNPHANYRLAASVRGALNQPRGTIASTWRATPTPLLAPTKRNSPGGCHN